MLFRVRALSALVQQPEEPFAFGLLAAGQVLENQRLDRPSSWAPSTAPIQPEEASSSLRRSAICAPMTNIKGRDIMTGSPGAIEITAGEVYPVAHEVVRKVEEIISTTLTQLPPRWRVIFMIEG
jgi:hypothetical protein